MPQQQRPARDLAGVFEPPVGGGASQRADRVARAAATAPAAAMVEDHDLGERHAAGREVSHRVSRLVDAHAPVPRRHLALSSAE